MEDNTELDLRKIGWEGVNWIHLAQNRDQWWVLLVPQKAGISLPAESTTSFSTRALLHGISYDNAIDYSTCSPFEVKSLVKSTRILTQKTNFLRLLQTFKTFCLISHQKTQNYFN
jgi:hypothetical protein